MKYVPLGRSGLRVGRIALGTVNMGWKCDESESFAILDRAVELGINLIDTADSYNYSLGENRSECIVGRWLALGGGRREAIVLATKVYGTVGPGPNDGRLSAYHIRRACDESLRRLRSDHIDLYQMHHVDRDTPWDEIWEALSRLVQEGKVLYVGSSNFAGWQIAAAHLGRPPASLGLVSEQSLYHLGQRAVELEVLPACECYGLGFLAYAPLGGGLLAGPRSPDSGGRRSEEDARRSREQLRDKLASYEKLCADLGSPPSAVALAWLLHQPGLTAPIVGPREVRQLNEGVAALEINLGDVVMGELDRVWAGPGGPAPEAYAW